MRDIPAGIQPQPTTRSLQQRGLHQLNKHPVSEPEVSTSSIAHAAGPAIAFGLDRIVFSQVRRTKGNQSKRRVTVVYDTLGQHTTYQVMEPGMMRPASGRRRQRVSWFDVYMCPCTAASNLYSCIWVSSYCRVNMSTAVVWRF